MCMQNMDLLGGGGGGGGYLVLVLVLFIEYDYFVVDNVQLCKLVIFLWSIVLCKSGCFMYLVGIDPDLDIVSVKNKSSCRCKIS